MHQVNSSESDISKLSRCSKFEPLPPQQVVFPIQVSQWIQVSQVHQVKLTQVDPSESTAIKYTQVSQ